MLMNVHRHLQGQAREILAIKVKKLGAPQLIYRPCCQPGIAKDRFGQACPAISNRLLACYAELLMEKAHAFDCY
jgi:hypothetical protein